MLKPLENIIDVYALDFSTGKTPEEKLKTFIWEGEGLGLSIIFSQSGIDERDSRDFHSLAKDGLNQGVRPPEVAQDIISSLGAKAFAQPSVRFCLVTLSVKGASLSVYCEGYPAPIVVDSGGNLEPDLKPAGQETKTALEKKLSGGETIVVYTPDLAELAGKGGSGFGEMYIKSLTLQNHFRTSEEIALTISQAAWMHHGEIWMEPVNLAVIKYRARG